MSSATSDTRTIGVATPADVRDALIHRREIALLDVREEAPYAEGHPLFAASLPLGRLEMEIFDRVPRRATRVVVYDSGDGLSERGAERLIRLGYSDVALLDGGLQGWRDAGGEIFRDVNAPSKAFGELVEARRHTPSLDASEVKALLDEGADVAILDARRFDEYHTMSIPTATSVPGAELVYRARMVAPSRSTMVIVNCAGRTRSIIGTQSLLNAGIANRVAALRNGTIGWTLAALALDRGQTRAAPPVPPEEAAAASAKARAVADRAGVERTTLATVERWIREGERTIYRFDVRSPEEYAAGHVPGFRSVPGGQLVQETDVFAPVRGGRIALWDGEFARADMTGSWLAQMGWDVYVVEDVDPLVARERGVWSPSAALPPQVAWVQPVELEQERARGAVVIDVASSRDYLRGHIPGAWLASRTSLARTVAAVPAAARYLVTSTDGLLAAFTAPELGEITGADVAVVDGGTSAWIAGGGALTSGPEHVPVPPIDLYKRPYEGTDNDAAAMRAYLEWEFGLVAQLERDGTHGFRVI